MESSALSQLLKLPAGDRAELAMALWESLSDAERQGELALTEEQGAEIDRRWAEHLANPGSAVPWSEVRRRLLGLGGRALLFSGPQAEREALEVRRWYEARREGLGNEFGAEVDEIVARIASTPLAFQRVRGETRRGVLSRSVALADSIVAFVLCGND